MGLPNVLPGRDGETTVTPESLSMLILPVAAVERIGGGRRTGDGARLGLALWRLSVLKGPKNGLVDGVKAFELKLLKSLREAAECWNGGDCSAEECSENNLRPPALVLADEGGE